MTAGVCKPSRQKSSWNLKRNRATVSTPRFRALALLCILAFRGGDATG